MNKIVTSCAKCIHSTMDGNEQNGCELELLETLGVESSHEYEGKTYKIVNGVCMSRSYDEKRQVKQVFNIVVLHGASEGNKDRLLDDILNDINSIEIPNVEIRIIICHSDDPVKIRDMTSHIKKEVEIVWVLDELYENQVYDDAFRRCKNGYVIYVNSGFQIPQESLEKLRDAASTGKKVLYVEGDEQGNMETYFAVFYKYLKGNKIEPIYGKFASLEDFSKHSFKWSDL